MRVPIFCNDYVLLRIYGCGGVFYDIQTRQALSRLLNKSTSVAYNFVITKKTFFQFPVLPLCQCLTLCFPVQRLCPCLSTRLPTWPRWMGRTPPSAARQRAPQLPTSPGTSTVRTAALVGESTYYLCKSILNLLLRGKLSLRRALYSTENYALRRAPVLFSAKNTLFCAF